MLTLEYDGKLWSNHRKAVAAICNSMRRAHQDRTGPIPPLEVPGRAPSELADLNCVVEVVTQEFTAWVEPNVTMDMLVRSTMNSEVARASRLIPTVLATSKATTVAEAFAAATCGSSSFRLGAFDCAVLSLEAVLHDGQHVEAKVGDCDADLLLEKIRASPSLAVITLFQIALVPATEYVELAYWPVSGIAGAMLRMKPAAPDPLVLGKAAMNETIEFVDCIMFGLESAVVVTGRSTPPPDFESSSRLGEGDNFVQHAKSIYGALLHKKGPQVEIIPLIDYLFRYHECGVMPLRVNRRSHDRRHSLMAQDPVGVSQDVAFDAESVETYVESVYECISTCTMVITPVEPRSRLGMRRFDTETTADKVRWNVRTLNSGVM